METEKFDYGYENEIMHLEDADWKVLESFKDNGERSIRLIKSPAWW